MSDQIEPLKCPLCGDGTVVRLPDDWQEQVEAGASVPIIGPECGNPWHYANLDRASERDALAAVADRRGWVQDGDGAWHHCIRDEQKDVIYWDGVAYDRTVAKP